MNTKNILTYAIWAGLLVVPFIAFIVPEKMFFPFISGKGFTFRILVEILFALYVILAFRFAEYRPKNTWLTKSIGIFTLVILIANLLGENVSKSLWSNYERMEGFVLIAHLALYYIVVSSFFRTARDWYKWFNVSLGASVIMSLYGVLQLLGKITINQGGVRLDGTFGNASYFAIYLVFHIFLSMYMFAQTRSNEQRWVYGIIAVGEAWILYFTATRGAILGFIGGLLLASIFVAWKERENKMLRKTAIGVLIAVVVVLIGFISFKNTDFVKNSPVLSRFATMGSAEIRTQGRYYVWPMAIEGIKERPLLGWGQENFNFVFNKNYNPEMYAQEQWFDRTHNIVLDWLIAGGIIGFASYALIYVFLLYYIWNRRSGMSITEKSLLTGMISAYVFHNMFVFDNLISYIMFFSVLAYVNTRATVGGELNQGSNSQTQSSFYTKTFSNETNNYFITPLVVIVCIGAIYFVNVPAIKTNFNLIKSMVPQQTGGVEKNLEMFKTTFSYNSFGNSEALEQLVQITGQVVASNQVSESIKQEFYNFTKQKLEEKLRQTPNDARYVIFATSFFNRMNKYDEALKYGEKAIELSPRKQAFYFELGTSYVGKGQYDKAFEQFKKAYDLAPEAPESKIIYTVGAIYTKNNAIVNEMLSKIDNNLLIIDNRFLRAYADTGNMTAVINILKERIKLEPTNAQYKLSLASAYLQAGQKQMAINVIQEMINADPGFKEQGESYIREIQSQ